MGVLGGSFALNLLPLWGYLASAEAAHNGVPLVSLSLNCACLDGAFDFTMKLDLDMPYFGEMETVLDDFIAALWIGQRVIAVPTL